MNMDNKLVIERQLLNTRNASILAQVLFALCILFSLLPSGLNWSQNVANANIVEGSRFVQIQFGLLFLLAGIIVWNNQYVSFRHISHLNIFLLLFIAWCFISMIWSPYPFITFKRAIQQLGLIAVGLAISPPILHKKQFSNTLLLIFTILLFISLLTALLFPSLGIDVDLDHAWRGILPHKNALGVVAALSVFLWIRHILDKQISPLILTFFLVFSFSMLIMSKATTPLLVVLFCISLYLLILKNPFSGSFIYTRLLLLMSSIVLLALWLFYTLNSSLPSWEQLFYPIEFFFNKSSTLTGRTDIWALVFLSIDEHPINGIGYGAFWLGQDGPSQYVSDVLHWVPMQAHNGYIDIINELGFVGLGLFLGVIIVHIRNLFLLNRIDKADAALHIIIFLFAFISNFSESDFFRGLLFKNMLFIFSSVIVSSRLTQEKNIAPSNTR